MTSLTLYAKLETLPPELKSEASDFIDFLRDHISRIRYFFELIDEFLIEFNLFKI
ncbi:MAG: DUF2281 domain-containing protein, partial [Flavobacterium sp.]